MVAKLTWPNNKFLLPTGPLPPVVPVEDFEVYEDLRTGKFSHTDPIAEGYEYYYLIKFDPRLINNSPIGSKVRGVHGPWTRMNQHPGFYAKLIYYIMSHPKVAPTASQGVWQTIKFAKEIGAEYVVIHTSEMDLDNLDNFMSKTIALAKEQKIKFFPETEGLDIIKTLTPNVEKWHYDHLSLFNKFHLPIVFDPATIEMNGQDIFEVWKELETASKGNINSVVAHIHLNEFIPGFNRDHGVMKSEKYARLLKMIAKSGYSGYFTFEEDAIQTRKDFLIAALYTIGAFLKVPKLFPHIAKSYTAIMQKYLYDSVVFSEINLKK